MSFLEEMVALFIVWIACIFITGIAFNDIVVKFFGGQWILSGGTLAIFLYMVYKGLVTIGKRE